ncbi:MAG: MGMT family protein [Planctomycetota bacterium]
MSTTATSFTDRVYELCRQIPKGRVASYADLAAAAGSPGAARAVGNAMRTNPDVPRTPCHRVVASDGRLHGYLGGLDKKAKLLRSEGVEVTGSGERMRVACLEDVWFDDWRSV